MMDCCQQQGLASFTAAVLDGRIEPVRLAACYRNQLAGAGAANGSVTGYYGLELV
jgi:hypothetical protein